MNLIDLYDSLGIPAHGKKVFNAIVIPGYSDFRVAVDVDGNAVLLVSTKQQLKDFSLKNVRLKYLQLEQNVECTISENGSTRSQLFTVVQFTSADRHLQEYFLRVSETLVKAVGSDPSQVVVINALKRMIEVFKALSESPTNTVSGLWAELFLISNAKNPKTLMDYWHAVPGEKFDFNAGKERVEVKSSSSFERSHTFSADQLNPPEDTQVLVASLFLRQQANGESLQQLIDRITERISDDYSLVEKLNAIVSATLGNTLEHSLTISYDYEIAKQSLKFYRHQDIDKIERLNIPSNVSDVRYRSDLTLAQDTDITKVVASTSLFSSI